MFRRFSLVVIALALCGCRSRHAVDPAERDVEVRMKVLTAGATLADIHKRRRRGIDVQTDCAAIRRFLGKDLDNIRSADAETVRKLLARACPPAPRQGASASP